MVGVTSCDTNTQVFFSRIFLYSLTLSKASILWQLRFACPGASLAWFLPVFTRNDGKRKRVGCRFSYLHQNTQWSCKDCSDLHFLSRFLWDAWFCRFVACWLPSRPPFAAECLCTYNSWMTLVTRRIGLQSTFGGRAHVLCRLLQMTFSWETSKKVDIISKVWANESRQSSNSDVPFFILIINVFKITFLDQLLVVK